MAYISLSEFARTYGVKESTVLKRLKEIPGAVVLEDKTIVFIQGTRYPSARRKVFSPNDSVGSILDALNKNRYIGHLNLGMDLNGFRFLLSELEIKGYIIANGSENTFGANGYSITLEGNELLKDIKHRRVMCRIEEAGAIIKHLIVSPIAEAIANAL